MGYHKRLWGRFVCFTRTSKGELYRRNDWTFWNEDRVQQGYLLSPFLFLVNLDYKTSKWLKQDWDSLLLPRKTWGLWFTRWFSCSITAVQESGLFQPVSNTALQNQAARSVTKTPRPRRWGFVPRLRHKTLPVEEMEQVTAFMYLRKHCEPTYNRWWGKAQKSASCFLQTSHRSLHGQSRKSSITQRLTKKIAENLQACISSGIVYPGN